VGPLGEDPSITPLRGYFRYSFLAVTSLQTKALVRLARIDLYAYNFMAQMAANVGEIWGPYNLQDSCTSSTSSNTNKNYYYYYYCFNNAGLWWPKINKIRAAFSCGYKWFANPWLLPLCFFMNILRYGIRPTIVSL
jgi:hypothetical protein